MSDTDNYRFNIDDVGEDENTSPPNFNTPDTSTITIATTLLPFTILGVVAFLQESVMAASLSALGFTGLALDALVAVFSLMGFLTVGGIVLVAFLTVVALLVSVVRRSATAGGLGLLGLLYFGAAFVVATVVFGSLPLLVGYVLASTLIIYSAMLLVGAISGVAILAVAP